MWVLDGVRLDLGRVFIVVIRGEQEIVEGRQPCQRVQESAAALDQAGAG